MLETELAKRVYDWLVGEQGYKPEEIAQSVPLTVEEHGEEGEMDLLVREEWYIECTMQADMRHVAMCAQRRPLVRKVSLAAPVISPDVFVVLLHLGVGAIDARLPTRVVDVLEPESRRPREATRAQSHPFHKSGRGAPAGSQGSKGSPDRAEWVDYIRVYVGTYPGESPVQVASHAFGSSDLRPKDPEREARRIWDALGRCAIPGVIGRGTFANASLYLTEDDPKRGAPGARGAK